MDAWMYILVDAWKQMVNVTDIYIQINRQKDILYIFVPQRNQEFL